MKVRKRLMVLMCCVSLLGCRNIFVDKTKLFLPGTYIRFSEHAFGKEYDTISISLDDETADAYQIVRRWRYERIRDGALLEPEYKVTRTMGYYKRSKNYLWENGSGTIYHFDRKRKLLKNGAIKFIKL